MKKMINLLFVLLLVSLLCGCSKTENLVGQISEEIKEDTHVPVVIKESEDKHISYIKDYVGKNCATVAIHP